LLAVPACGDDDDTEPSSTDGGDTDVDAAHGDTKRDAAMGARDGGGKSDASSVTADASSVTADASAGSSDGGGEEAPGAGLIGTDIEGEHDHDQFGSSVALSADGTRVIAGAMLNNDAASQAGHARVFERKSDGWVQLGDDLDGDAEKDRFGVAVAISDDGNRVAVGSSLNDGNGVSSGLVRVFDWTDGAWEQVGSDIHGAKNSGEGRALGISADGKRIVVGSEVGNAVGGSAVVYEEDGGDWSQVGDRLAGTNQFGQAVAISDDGNRIAVSFPSAVGQRLPGTVRVYDLKSSTWTQVGADIAGEAEAGGFGTSLALSGAGDVLVVGAPANPGLGLTGGGVAGGSVRALTLKSGKWQQLGQDLDGEPGFAFGTSVDVSADGTRLIAGGPSPGFAAFYVLEGDSWAARDIDFGNSGRAGSSVAISADGEVGAVGSIYFAGKQGNASGSVRVYALGD
jgi:WD40 repeat protein